MPFSTTLIRKITEIDPSLREILFLMLEEIEKQRAQWEESVIKTEFNELKEVIQEVWKSINELAEAQKRTEQALKEFEEKTEKRFQEVWKSINELTEAQKKTEQRLNELTEAQKRTEQRLNELAEAQKRTEQEILKLTKGLSRTRKEVSGLARSMAYALENEAYRHLPAFLKTHYGIELIDRLIRTYINGEEVNIFGKARQNGQEVFLVGEVVLKLDDPSKLKQVWKKIKVVKENFGGEVVPVIVTHFARPNVSEKARKAGIIVIQSFEWI